MKEQQAQQRDLDTVRQVAERYEEQADVRNQSRQAALDEARQRMEAKR